ncbi:alpha/beta-hydrolase [Marasmius fiardii PR-910]|nr:alpha/beta-hydrolase [Marasmius fiardii PR-910]
MAEYSHLSKVDEEIAPLLENLLSVPSLDEGSLPAVRKYFAKVGVPRLEKKYEPLLPEGSEYTVKDHEIDVGGGVTVLARAVTPVPRDGEDETFPLLFWIHGGDNHSRSGFVIGNLHMDDYRLRIASVKLRFSVVNCEYRLAPEHPFPTAVASHPDTFSASLKKGFLVGGQSAGGNLAAVQSWIARDDPFFKNTPLTGQLLQIPYVVHHQAVPDKYKPFLLSLEQNKDAPLLSRESLFKIRGSFRVLRSSIPTLYKASPEDPRASPLLSSSHRGLPPAFLQVCGLDPLRDEGLLYEKVLKEAGVPTKLEV